MLDPLDAMFGAGFMTGVALAVLIFVAVCALMGRGRGEDDMPPTEPLPVLPEEDEIYCDVTEYELMPEWGIAADV